MEGSRAARHRRPRSLKWVGLVGILLLVTLGLVLWQFVPRGKHTVTKSTPSAQSSSVSAATYAVLVADGGKKGSTLKQAALVAVKTGSSSKVGVALPGSAFINVPGRGPEALSQAYAVSPKYALAALANLTGLDIEGYVVVTPDIYDRAVSDNEMALLFDRAVASDLASRDLQDAANGFDNANNSIQEVRRISSRAVRIGSQSYHQLDKGALAAGVKAVWGVELSQEPGSVRVIVLNGSGVPGVGSKVADLMMAEGMTIVDVRNADNFDHKQTLIYSYGSSFRQAAEKAVGVLKVGSVRNQDTPQDITDLLVIVGADFGR